VLTPGKLSVPFASSLNLPTLVPSTLAGPHLLGLSGTHRGEVASRLNIAQSFDRNLDYVFHSSGLASTYPTLAVSAASDVQLSTLERIPGVSIEDLVFFTPIDVVISSLKDSLTMAYDDGNFALYWADGDYDSAAALY
jgi:hypothetical protein